MKTKEIVMSFDKYVEGSPTLQSRQKFFCYNCNKLRLPKDLNIIISTDKKVSTPPQLKCKTKCKKFVYKVKEKT